MKILTKSSTFMAKKAVSNLFSPSPRSLASSSSFPRTHFPSFPSDHTFSLLMMEETIENAESIIKKWDANPFSYTKMAFLFQQNRREAKELIKSVRKLHRAMHFLVSEDSHSEKLVLAQTLMQTAMGRLQKEFYQILSSKHDRLDPKSVSVQSSNGSRNAEFDDDVASNDEDAAELTKASETINEVERAPAMAMSDLKTIAECMISCGYGKECVEIYKLNRKSVIDEGLHLLEIKTYKSSKIHRMNWDPLEHMIKNWVKAVNIAVKTLFHGEKILCDHVFSASEMIRESCFYKIVKEGATNLFRFPEVVATDKKSPERIFRLMELHEAISNLRPDIESIFQFESMAAVKLQALSSLHKIEGSVHTILSDFESSIQNYSSKILIDGGGIHPLARSAMSYISSLAEYSYVLSEILAKHSPTRHSPLPESYLGNQISDDDLTQAASLHLAWLILVLLCKLDTKARLYKDVPLTYLFLANNLHFIINEVRSTHLRSLLRDNWIANHDKKVKSYASSYETAAWAKVFVSLPDKSLTLSPEEAKEHLTRFHSVFKEEYAKQSPWIILDRKLRDELKVSIAAKLVPQYREFYEKYLGFLSQEKNLEMLVTFGPDNLENYLSDLFHGSSVLSSSSSSSSSCSSRGRVPY